MTRVQSPHSAGQFLAHGTNSPDTRGALRSAGLALLAASILPALARAQPADPAIAYSVRYKKQGKFVFDVMVMNADGSNKSRVLPNWLGQDLSWSPDADGNPANGFQGTLTFTSSQQPNDGSPDIYLVDVRVVGGVPIGSNLRKVVDSAIDPFAGTWAVNPEWSPDMEAVTPGYQGKVVYSSERATDTCGLAEIAVQWNGATLEPVFGPNTSTPLTPLYANTGPLNPTFSPDGGRVATPHWSGVSGILIVDAISGQELSFLPTSMWFADNQWSRTGSRLVLRNGQSLYTLDVDLGAGSLQQIPGVSGSNPTWSPHDEYIAYVNGSTIRRRNMMSGQEMVLAS